mmetsp:Transcript_42042/g.134230  ORF Transcript_42042/g.134230 Transcript_42042/m.134230 type:complete len:592 (+) Transcript_42042:810-2585(+)
MFRGLLGTVLALAFASATAAQSLELCSSISSSDIPSECTSYTYPDASSSADIDATCLANSKPTACAIWKKCGAGDAFGAVCEPFRVLATLCSEVPSAPGCATYGGLCSPGSVVRQCSEAPALENLVTGEVLQRSVISMCNQHYMNGCNDCTSDDMCPSPFAAMSKVCQYMYMSDCDSKGFVGFCNSAGEGLYSFCAGVRGVNLDYSEIRSSAAMSDGGGDDDKGTVVALDGCYSASHEASCKSFEPARADLEADLVSLCDADKSDEAIPTMSGCSVRNLCASGEMSGAYCEPLSILASVCLELPDAPGCERYQGVCGQGSVVEACISHRAVAGLVPRDVAVRTTIDMCSIHGMTGCSDCLSPYNCPAPIVAYSTVCLHMDMGSYCSDWKKMCEGASADLGSLCSILDGSALPIMRMYFHYGLQDIVLWKELVPKTEGQYAGAFICIVALGMVTQLLKRIRIIVEARWERDAPKAVSGTSVLVAPKGLNVGTLGAPNGKARMAWLCPPSPGALGILKMNTVRALFTGVVVFFDYCLMLIAMTFNVGMFIAVILGFTLGTLCFAHVGSRSASEGVSQSDLEAGAADMNSCCDG